MSYELPLLIFTNFIALCMVLVIILAHTVSRPLRATLVATIMCLLLWQDTIYIADHMTSNLIRWNNLVFLWPTLSIVSFYMFIYYLETSRRKLPTVVVKIRHILTTFLVLATGLQLGAWISTHIFESVVYQNGIHEFTRGIAYYVYIVGLVLGFLVVIVALIAGLINSQKSRQERQALYIVFLTVIMAMVYGVIVNILIPLLSGSQALIGFGMVTVIIFAVGFAISIFQGGLLDIKLYVIRTVVYVLSLGTLALTYAVLAYLSSLWLLGHELPATQTALNIGLALLLAFIFQPIKRFFDQLTNHVFYRDNYNSDDFFRSINHTLTSTIDLRGLLQRAAIEVASTLKAKQGFFFVYSNEYYYVTTGTKQHSRLPLKDARALDSYVKTQGSRAIITELLPEDTTQRRLMISHRLGLVLPLVRSGTILGYLCLGDQQTRGYNTRDVRVLETLADELVIAIQNALSIQAVRELNDTLQQRIDEATRELRATNAQLQRLDEAKDEFVSMASHQLRTPLTSVKGYISMLLEGDAGQINDTQKHFLSEAFTSSERMVHLIDDFLNVSRLQTGKFVIDRRLINLKTITEQEVESLRTTAKQRQLTLKLKTQARIPSLYLDENKIRQVIMNFIDNALYYSAASTTIAIELKVEDGNVALIVKDTGIGVPESEQAHLFTKFYRASNARKQRPDGTGVGLFLAKKVIDAHGGSMIFTSEEGKGSTFGFTLPIAKLERAPADDADNLDN